MSSNESPFNKVTECRHGLMVYNVNDKFIGKSLGIYGEYSEGEIDLFNQIVKEGHFVLEIGANIGAHTIFLAKKAGIIGRVYAFEPQRLVFQALCANIALNSIANAYCYNTAVGASVGSIPVPRVDPWFPDQNFGGLELNPKGGGELVPMITIDSMRLDACHFIKVDVEGMELEVLKGGQALIARCAPILYLENDRQEKSADLIRYVDSLGYYMYWHFPLLYNPNNFLGNPTNIFGNIGSHNMLCIHKSANCQLDGWQKVEIPRH